MYKDLEPELVVQVDESKDDLPIEIPDYVEEPPITDRFDSWLKIIDN